MLIKSHTDIDANKIIGANAEMRGESIPDDPIALDIPKAPQNIIDIPTAIPIPNNVPRFPIVNENGIAISTMIRLEKGKEYL